MKIVGIDPGVSCTAVVRCDGEHATFKARDAKGGIAVRFERYEDHVANILEYVRDYQPESIFLENYAFASNTAHQTTVIEFGALLRWHLIDIARVWEVAPMTLKKFGGVTKKSVFAAAIAHRYDVLFKTDDEYDAFALMKFGRCAAGLEEPQNQKQREAVGAFRPYFEPDPFSSGGTNGKEKGN